jgi:hemolysin III
MVPIDGASALRALCPMKWRLRRLDQSAVYVLIAAPYTAFVVDTKASTTALGFLIGVWCVAAFEIAAALALLGRSTAF